MTDRAAQPGRLAELGLHRPPLLTAAIAVVTAVTSVVGLLWPAFLGALERTPAGVHGEPWRWVSALLGQDGGLVATIGSLLFLVAIGAAAEQVVGRWAWAGLYLGGGLAGQAAGYLWLPVGAGNSVAVCGLAGALAWYVVRPDLPRWAGPALALWAGVLLGTWWPPMIGVGILAAVADHLLARFPARHRIALVAGSAAVAAVLVALGNVHGAALAAGLVLGGLLAAADRSAGRPTASSEPERRPPG